MPLVPESNAEVRAILRGATGPQSKSLVGPADDAFEREADQAAERIAAGQPVQELPHKPEDEVPRRVRRETEDDDGAGGEVDEAELDAAAALALHAKGAGRPLEAALRERLETGLDADLGDVRVHDDAAARAAAVSLRARAFTHGSDIWLGPGESQADTRLMAHEATHVLQQSGPARRQVRRKAAGSGGSGPLAVDTLYLPKIKHRLKKEYAAWTPKQRVKAYKRGKPEQKDVWLGSAGVKLPVDKVLKRLDVDLTNPPATLALKVGSKKVTLGSTKDLIEDLKIPRWNKRLEVFDNTPDDKKSMQVDHQVELQVGGWPTSPAANALSNLELLDANTNRSSGTDMLFAIRSSVAKQMIDDGLMKSSESQEAQRRKVRGLLSKRGAIFKAVSDGAWPNPPLYAPLGDSLAAGAQTWSRDEIALGSHLDLVEPAKTLGEEGDDTTHVVLLPARTSELGSYKHAPGPGAQSIPIPAAKQTSVAGLKVTAVNLDAGRRSAKKDAKVGSLDVELDTTQWLKLPKIPARLPLARHTENTSYIASVPALGKGQLDGLSPIGFGHAAIADGKLQAVGRLDPSLPLLGGVPLEVRLNGRDVELAYTYDAGELALPIPRLTIDDSSLWVSFGTAGLGAGGDVEFSIEGLGSGLLGARASQQRGFEAEGSFAFDSELFDRADIAVWYREQRFGGRGTVAITQPGKLRGVRSADLMVEFEAGTLKARGSIEPDLRGMQRADLTAQNDPTRGFVATSRLLLDQGFPGLHSGSLDLELSRPADGDWAVRGRGTARPSLPGVESDVTLAFDNGAFDAGFEGSFQRGLLSGQASGGVSNRSLDAQGRPNGPPIAGAPLLVWGGGLATLRITPWLQGKAGLRFAPDGEVTVSGEIGLPSQVQIFDRRSVDRKLLDVAMQVPIVPGIVAEVGGNLSAQAGVGPGMLEQLRLGVEYNPAHEDRTTVTGDAHLRVPADAGLRLGVRAGIGVGIPLASATGGFDINGTLGVAGAAQAGVHVEWSPARGLTLAAEAEIGAEPTMRFGIDGYVSVRAAGLSIYEQRWNLAGVEYGSGLRFGIRFPVRYVEGRPFSISVDDVQFIVPPIDPPGLLRGLIGQIAGA